jgi:signal transduction histidine kinase
LNSHQLVKGRSGLGLTIVKAIARAHRDHVRVLDGPQGNGVTLMVLIPLMH